MISREQPPLRGPLPAARAASAVLLSVALLAACGDSGQGANAQGGGAPPPPPVGVITAEPQTVPLGTELPGRVEASRIAQVRARVTGVVLRRLFREGSEVKAGQALFEIDSAPYRAQIDSARASLARSEANLAQAKATVDRYRPLAEANAISRQDYVNAEAAHKAAIADVAAGRAAVQTARINLDYARVTAPISGRIGRALVTEGALVSATEATQLALIQQTQKVYVNFTQSSTEVLRLRRAVESKRVQSAGNGQTLPVTVVLEDGTELANVGRLLFTDLTVDETSGQVTLRAEVPNDNGLLLPGQYVRVRLTQAELPDGYLVPQQAVTRSSSGDTLLVIGPENKPQQRTVTLRGELNNQWIVTGGLQAGDRIIVDGFQKMMVPGAPVTPVPWQASAPQGGAPQASAPEAATAPASAASDR